LREVLMSTSSADAQRVLSRRLALSLRATATEAGILTGYASVFNMQDSQGDVVLPGAFRQSLASWQQQGRMPALLWQHDPRQPVGAMIALSEDGRGLQLEAQLALASGAGREAWELLRAGALDGLSIGFRTIRAERGPDGSRRILEAELWEVSLVTFPANPAARVTGVKAALAASVRALALKIRGSEG
jgi:uncharacterized protein